MRHETDWPTPAELKEFRRELERQKSYKPQPTPWGDKIAEAFAYLLFGFFAFAAMVATFALVFMQSFWLSVLLTVLCTVLFLASLDTPR